MGLLNSAPSLAMAQTAGAGAAAGKGGFAGGAGRVGYGSVLAFYILYFFRPEDYIPGLGLLPTEKIVGGLAVLALLGAILGGRFRRGREATLMAALLIYWCLCVPTSIWQSNSVTLIMSSAKCMLILIATLCMADTVARCRKIMSIETLAMLFMAAMALGSPRHVSRMYGVGAMFSDPNDFALYLCTILPFCVAFCLLGRTRIRRLFWVGGAGLAVTAILATSSRGGFLALVATLLALAWRFPGWVRRVVVVVMLSAFLAAAALSGTPYMHRLDTILHPGADKTGSAQEREALFDRSLEVTLAHPLLGVGPGNFEIVSGVWHATHNTFTQLSAEAGIPSLLLFLALIWRGFRNLHAAPEHTDSGTAALIAAVECSLIGYLVGAIFLSTAYYILPYLLIAYSVILIREPRPAHGMPDPAAGASGPGLWPAGLPQC